MRRRKKKGQDLSDLKKSDISIIRLPFSSVVIRHYNNVVREARTCLVYYAILQ